MCRINLDEGSSAHLRLRALCPGNDDKSQSRSFCCCWVALLYLSLSLTLSLRGAPRAWRSVTVANIFWHKTYAETS